MVFLISYLTPNFIAFSKSAGFCYEGRFADKLIPFIDSITENQSIEVRKSAIDKFKSHMHGGYQFLNFLSREKTVLYLTYEDKKQRIQSLGVIKDTKLTLRSFVIN